MYLRAIFVTFSVVLFTLVSTGAQQPTNAPTPAPHSGPTGAKGPASQKTEPCWEQAGISKSIMEQRKSIQESTRSQVQAVCSETNLSEQQKREQIRQIRQAGQEKVNAMISPAEREQLEACQRARRPSSPHTGSHPAGSDPCAGLGR
jgi:hypothetical protein